MIRVAAVGDVHFGKDFKGRLKPHLARLEERADVLIIAGDLTQHGLAEEGQVLADELAGCGVPIVSILGNHDYHANQQDRIRRQLEDVGVKVLECESLVLNVRGKTLGITGTKGFGGGFAGACASEFGEPEMKAFIHHTKAIAEKLASLLCDLKADTRIAVTHYSPTKTTLLGEKLEIYPFLGSYLLGEAIDHAHVDLAIHGHAHHGTERGVTPGGVAVRNVALPVIKVSYNVYTFDSQAERQAAL